MKRTQRHRVALASFALWVTATSAAFAQLSADETRNAARNMAGDAKAAFEQGEFERARDLFHRAYSLVQAPTIAVFEARALVQLQRLVEAEEAYNRAVRTKLDASSPEAFQRAVEEAETELAELRPRVPRLIVVPTGPGAQHPELELRIDGNALPPALRGVEAPLDPGHHTLVAALPGGAPIEIQFELVERQKQRLEVAVPAPAKRRGVPSAKRKQGVGAAPEPTATPRPQSTRPWQTPVGLVAGGIGVAGLATGIIAGVAATSRHDDASKACPGGACEPDSQGWQDAEAFRTLRTVSSVGYVVGIAGLAGGVTLLLTAPSAKPSPGMALRVSANSLELKGSF